MVDFATQRKAMVESQVRASDITDRRIIRAMQAIPREAYLPDAMRALAYMDEDVALSPPAAKGRALMAPRTFAKLVQLAGPNETDSVLVVGAGAGYSAAVLATMAARVLALEDDASLISLAPATVAESGRRITRLEGPLNNGSEAEAPFDVIFVEGAVRVMPPALLDQLKDGGRLVAVLIEDGLSRGAIWRRHSATFDRQLGFDAGAAELPGFQQAPQFVF